MTHEQKNKVQQCLKEYCQRYESQNAAANRLTGISPATISQVLNGNWDNIADSMWRKIAKQIGFNLNTWVVAETSVNKKVTAFFGDAQRNPHGIRALVVKSSMGKTTAINGYCEKHTNAYFVKCHRHMPPRVLLREMLKAMGKEAVGTLCDMIYKLVTHLEKENEPVFIIDEVDKVKDEVLELFIDLENKFHGKCGLVFLSTAYMRTRIESGVERGKRGYPELYSRCKKMFWDLTPSKKEFADDASLIAKANGITNENVIIEITNKCDYDLRVLSDLITAEKSKAA